MRGPEAAGRNKPHGRPWVPTFVGTSGCGGGGLPVWLFAFDGYTQGVADGVRELGRKGFVFQGEATKNGWADSIKPYKGINTTWLDPDTGQLFEMQFHTDDSFRINREEHGFYEIWRHPSSTLEQQNDARRESLRLWGTVDMPIGANLMTKERIRDLVATI